MLVNRDMTHSILSVLFICLLIALSFWILRPFLVSIVWGIIIVIASWPILKRLEIQFGMGRGLAAALMTTTLLLTFLVPLTLAIVTIARNSTRIGERLSSFSTFVMPAPPPWIRRIPLAGEKIANRWMAFASLSPKGRSEMIAPYAQKALQWFVAFAGSTGTTIVKFLLTVIFVTVLYARGESFREGLLAFCRRLAGQQGEDVAVLAAKAIRGVVLGVVLTALVQAAMGGIGLFITGIPAAGLLAAVMFILCLAQLGPFLVMVPSVIWLYVSGQAGWGTVLLIFTIIAGTIDNLLRPLLIKKGADLPLLLVILGVIGGLIAFGIIGVFIGPVILAITYTLVRSWVSNGVDVQREQLNSDPERTLST